MLAVKACPLYWTVAPDPEPFSPVHVAWSVRGAGEWPAGAAGVAVGDAVPGGHARGGGMRVGQESGANDAHHDGRRRRRGYHAPGIQPRRGGCASADGRGVQPARRLHRAAQRYDASPVAVAVGLGVGVRVGVDICVCVYDSV